MIFIHKKILITPLTTHLSLKKMIKAIQKKNYFYNKIGSLNSVLIKEFKIKNPIIKISGINPHAGENGNIGIEEKKYLNEDIKKLQNKGVTITGPFSADSMLINNQSKTDCFIFIYHDQALIPFKLISKYKGINYTGGLSIKRISPDHGTAYDMVGKKSTNTSSLLNCFKFLNKY